jgi:DNA-binding NtrC family response regulator
MHILSDDDDSESYREGLKSILETERYEVKNRFRWSRSCQHFANKNYEWPGNVRELENVLERATSIADEQTLQSKELALPLRTLAVKKESAESGDIGIAVGNPIAMKAIEKAHISGILNSVGWDKKLAAKILDINLKTLYIKIETYVLMA